MVALLPHKNTKGFHECADRTIAHCGVISIVDMGSNFFDEFPPRAGFHLKRLSILLASKLLEIQIVYELWGNL